MIASQTIPAPIKNPVRRLASSPARHLLAGLLTVAFYAAGPLPASERTAQASNLQAHYTISLGGMRIGRADVKGEFGNGEYSTAVSGGTAGIARLFSNTRGAFVSRGRLSPSGVRPTSYFSEMTQSRTPIQVSMSMSNGRVTKLRAVPGPEESDKRVTVRSSHKSNVVDPVGGFVVATGARDSIDGPRACSRTVRVFDGVQRYDVKLRYSKMKDVKGSSDAYSGTVAVCSARYVPIAGHETDREYVDYMASNRRLEVWLAPVKGAAVMVPIHILIGTEAGDLIIRARTFKVTAGERQASLR